MKDPRDLKDLTVHDVQLISDEYALEARKAVSLNVRLLSLHQSRPGLVTLLWDIREQRTSRLKGGGHVGLL